MNYCSPESKGIKSANIAKYIEELEKNKLCTHNVIIARGNDIIFEKYWAPFHKDFLHRQYSVSKSIVALAVGFLIQDGLVNLDDPIEKYFPDKITDKTNILLRRQTVRNMMNMATALPCEGWFEARTDDRVRFYFENKGAPAIPGGTLFRYDSSGTFVICALVERQTGMPFMDYLRIKLFDKIGVSKEATCLKCPGGHSWGDSAVLCTAQDLLIIARFTLNYGEWNGEQLIDRQYMLDATSPLMPNNLRNYVESTSYGYGYYIWQAAENSFAFVGMGNQYAICVPHKDIILIYNADNQGRKEQCKEIIFNEFFRYIVDPAEDHPVGEIKTDIEYLENITSDLKLRWATGEYTSPTADIVNNKTYKFTENRMGIKSMRLELKSDGGCLYYENQQGGKKIKFGFGRNEFGEFEQDGYSDIVGSEKGSRRYKCAASAVWISATALLLKVQIIDTYFGNFDMVLSFKDKSVAVESTKTAEDFLNEYYGRAYGETQ